MSHTTENPPLDELVVWAAMQAPIVTCTPETPLREVARMMASHRIHCVVVVGLEGTGATWGVVSDIDLVRAAATGDELTAGETAATEVVTASAMDSLAEAARLIGEHDVAHLLVVDDARSEPIGVISTLDLAQAIAGEAT